MSGCPSRSWAGATARRAVLLRDVHVLDPRAAIDARHDVRVRDGLIAELASRGALERRRGRRQETDRRRRAPAAATSLLRPARASAHARPGAQGGSRERYPRRRRGWLRCGDRDAQHRPRARLRAAAALVSRRCRARDVHPCGLPAAITRGLRASSSPRWPSSAGGRARVHRRRQARRERRHAAQGASVPAPVRRRARAARGGPHALARRLDARGRRQRRVRALRDSRPSPSPRWSRAMQRSPATRTHACTSSTSPAQRPSTPWPAKARGWRVSAEVSPAPPAAHRRGRARHGHPHEDAPAARHEADRMALFEGLRTARSTVSHRSRAARARREGGALRAGPDGLNRLETAFAALYTGLVLTGLSISRCWSSA